MKMKLGNVLDMNEPKRRQFKTSGTDRSGLENLPLLPNNEWLSNKMANKFGYLANLG